MKIKLTLLLALLVGVTGCPPRDKQDMGDDSQEPRTITCSEDSLRERAEALWAARVAEDWATAFTYEPQSLRAISQVEEYVDWKTKHEPFKIHGFAIERAQAVGTMGWIQLEQSSSIRLYPNAEPRTVKTWRKWHCLDGEWYPVMPLERQEEFPEPPAVRDAGEEKRLRDQVRTVFAARKSGDWKTVYEEMIDPRDQEEIPWEQFLETQKYILYLDCEIQWVEVIGDNGRVRVTYRTKLNDPSMQKIPAVSNVINESWVLVDGQWYLDPIRR